MIESLLIASRRLAAKNPMDWDEHYRNRNRRFRKQPGWEAWIRQGMGLTRQEDEVNSQSAWRGSSSRP
jgi:hypothetical protein